jgi:prepilin-type N-terminal cleavage/methylation domain-containing protein
MLKNRKNLGFTLIEMVLSLTIVGVTALVIMNLASANKKVEKARQLADQTLIYSKVFSDFIHANNKRIVKETNGSRVKVMGLYSYYTKYFVFEADSVSNYFPIGIGPKKSGWSPVTTDSMNVLRQKPCVAIIQSANKVGYTNKLLPILFYVDIDEIDKRKESGVLLSHGAISQKASLMLGGKGGYGYAEDNTNDPEAVNGVGHWGLNVYKSPKSLYFKNMNRDDILRQCLGVTSGWFPTQRKVAPGSVFVNFKMYPYYFNLMDDENISAPSDILWRKLDPDPTHKIGDYSNKNTTKTDLYLAHEVEEN